MSVILVVGTAKGMVIYRTDDRRQDWASNGLELNGWTITAATRDKDGRTYVGVTHDVYGAVIIVSDDLKSWRQIENGPRYPATDLGNEQHNRVIGAMDPMGNRKAPHRHVDQIWKLHAVDDVVYAGVSEAGLFRSNDRGESWDPVSGLNNHPTRDEWEPGFGGLCAHSILVDEKNSDRIWVGISAAGVFRSDDGGKTWDGKNDGVSKDEGYCVHGLAHDPNNANFIYRQDHRGMYRTYDGGDSWELYENGLPVAELSDGHKCVFGFPVEWDTNNDGVYALPLEADAYRYPKDGELKVYRTRAEGNRWETLSNGLPSDTFASILRGAMSVDHLSPGGVYFGTSAGQVFASSDNGDNWIRMPETLPRVLCVEAFNV